MTLVIIIFEGVESPNATLSKVTFLKTGYPGVEHLNWKKKTLGDPCLRDD